MRHSKLNAFLPCGEVPSQLYYIGPRGNGCTSIRLKVSSRECPGAVVAVPVAMEGCVEPGVIEFARRCATEGRPSVYTSRCKSRFYCGPVVCGREQAGLLIGVSDEKHRLDGPDLDMLAMMRQQVRAK